MFFDHDTIVAISTPPGRCGIGVVRLSGPRAQEIAAPLLRLRHPLAAGRVRFGEVLDQDGNVLDEAVVTLFAAPHSYTAEDVVEIAAHGAPVLLEAIVRACLAGGARLAEPGEFTQRAFLAGRLDLTQAEAVADLIAASTMEQARLAARQLGGALSQAVAPSKQALVELIATLEAGIDFAEDDIDVLPAGAIAEKLAAIAQPLARLAESYAYGRMLRDGFTLAIVGRPNAGKSSLFNRLLERDRAIVTAVPGTTRDPIHERLSLGGIPVELIDTAGLREVPEGLEAEAEQQGIARSRMAMAEADQVLVVIDASGCRDGEALHKEDAQTLASLAGRDPIVVMNKIDLVAQATQTFPGIKTSALTGDGIAELRDELLRRLRAPAGDSPLITNLRQHAVLTSAIDALGAAERGLHARVPHEMLLLDLYAALQSLDALTGVTTTDDILALIFSSFCIGK